MSDTSFLTDLATATKGVPSEMAQWWRDSHRWDRATHIYERHDALVETDFGIVNVSALVLAEDPDHTLWRYLGIVSDVLLLVIVLLVVLMVGVAIL